jgi:oligopeptidase A
MENWCYTKDTMNTLARHFVTSDPLPTALFDKIVAARNYRAGSATLRQVYFATLDLALHRGAPTHNVLDLQRSVAADNTVLPLLAEDRFLCSFSHIFAGGYAAGYYSYKWAEVLSADAFGAFRESGLDDPGAVLSVGRRFRDTVLALGGSRHPMEVFRQFRGREPSTRPLLEQTGLLS